MTLDGEIQDLRRAYLRDPTNDDALRQLHAAEARAGEIAASGPVPEAFASADGDGIVVRCKTADGDVDWRAEDQVRARGAPDWARGVDSNWAHTFAYVAGARHEYGDGLAIDAVPPGAPVPVTPFVPRDVVRVLAVMTDDGDGWSGTAVVELRDGRFAKVVGSCDTSGWG